jgi:hypothetical protein
LAPSQRRATPELQSFLTWLLRVHRRMRDETAPAAEEMGPLNINAVASYLLDPENAGCGDGLPLDRVSDMFLGSDANVPEPPSVRDRGSNSSSVAHAELALLTARVRSCSAHVLRSY